MEYFIEGGIADVSRTGRLDQRKRKPFAEDREMTCAKEPQGHVRHCTEVARDQHWVVVRPRSVRPGHENHKRRIALSVAAHGNIP